MAALVAGGGCTTLRPIDVPAGVTGREVEIHFARLRAVDAQTDAGGHVLSDRDLTIGQRTLSNATALALVATPFVIVFVVLYVANAYSQPS